MVTVLLKGVKYLLLEFELRESKEAKQLQRSSFYRVCGVQSYSLQVIPEVNWNSHNKGNVGF